MAAAAVLSPFGIGLVGLRRSVQQECRRRPAGALPKRTDCYIAWGAVPVVPRVCIHSRVLLLGAQVETADCIKNMEEIAAVPGVDMLFLGT